MAKVSVIIPAYNAMSYLPDTMKSVLKQTFSDFEVLVIDDGSSDGIVGWASQITDPRVKFISQKNQGTAAARNTGISHAKGEYIAFLDADDLWEPAKLEKQVHCLDNNPEVGLVDAWTVLVDEHGKSTGRVISHHAEGDVWKQVVETCNSTVCCGSSPMVRRCCFETLGLFDQNLFIEDIDMWLRIASRYHYGVVKEPLVRYRQHPNNKSKDCQSMLEGFRTVIEKTYQSLPTEILYLRTRSYGQLNLFLAWRAIDNRDYKQAIHFRASAIAHYPQLVYTLWFVRLSIAIEFIRLLGPQAYEQVRTLFRSLRRRNSSAATQ